MKLSGYRIVEEKTAIIVDNGYIDRKTIAGELPDDRCELLDEIENRANKSRQKESDSWTINTHDLLYHIQKAIKELRQENTR